LVYAIEYGVVNRGIIMVVHFVAVVTKDSEVGSGGGCNFICFRISEGEVGGWSVAGGLSSPFEGFISLSMHLWGHWM